MARGKRKKSPVLGVTLWRRIGQWNYKVKNGEFNSRIENEGPEREQRYNSTLSSTSALDGVGSQRHDPAALPWGRYPV